jgi:NAD(P)-dependent dehydrogenase (short-subunit alcohol dehydrogenase family)
MMARALVRNGAAKVYIGGRRLEVLEAAAASLGPAAVPIKCDVTSKESLQQAVDFIKQDTGYLNVLVCNSGIGGPQPILIQDNTTIEEWADSNWDISFEDYTNTFAVNTSAVWYTSIAFVKLLDAGNKKGNLEQTSQIIITSSIASYNKAAPGGWAYGQSKAAATHIAKHLSAALPKWNIR